MSDTLYLYALLVGIVLEVVAVEGAPPVPPATTSSPRFLFAEERADFHTRSGGKKIKQREIENDLTYPVTDSEQRWIRGKLEYCSSRQNSTTPNSSTPKRYTGNIQT